MLSFTWRAFTNLSKEVVFRDTKKTYFFGESHKKKKDFFGTNYSEAKEFDKLMTSKLF